MSECVTVFLCDATDGNIGMRMAKHKPANSLLTETPRADTYKAVKKSKDVLFCASVLAFDCACGCAGYTWLKLCTM